MKSQLQSTSTPTEALSLYQHILVALDSSDHANAGMDIAVEVAGFTQDAQISGVHAYAAKLHDVRFRQMEGGLPEQFREEQELERQRDVHDDLITRGLSIITDSYLDQADKNCEQAGINFVRRSLEGKNYRALTQETNCGKYDLLVMGALGLGAVDGSRLGTVCQRVTRRSNIDTLVIKQPGRSLSEGPIVVAVDGSAKAYGGLLTAMRLAQQWRTPLKVIAVFDPYFHYVAFNRIADVLSDEASKVFRFKEQEQLHEEIIDSGLAKIYQGHLDVAQSIARDHELEIEAVLLDGKPHDAINKYVKQTNPSLLVIGKLGIHADDKLDIGGNTENILNDVGCAVLLSQREHQPRLDVVADVTTSWTNEAERAMDRVPGFVRNMARMAILRHAQERGHTVITENIVEEATASLCPSHARQAITEIVEAYDAGGLNTAQKQNKGFEKMDWSTEAEILLNQAENSSVRNNLRKRAEKKAHSEGAMQVLVKHLESFLSMRVADTEEKNRVSDTDTGDVISNNSGSSLYWQAAALARLMRVPDGFMRDTCRQNIEDFANKQGETQITLELAEAGLKKSRQMMESSMKNGEMPKGFPSNTPKGKCPFAASNSSVSSETEQDSNISWSSEALVRLDQIPAGMSRDMTHRAANAIADKNGAHHIDRTFLENILSTFQSGSADVSETLSWDADARASIERAPDMVRGMLIKEIENWARQNNLEQVSEADVKKVKAEWQQKGFFHIGPDDPR